MNKRNHLPVILSVLFLAMTVFSCDAPLNVRKLKIMTSVFPLQEFASAVAGKRGEVSLLLPPGAGVHTWQPRAGDILRLRACDLFVYIGADLEPWLDEMRKGLSGKKIEFLEASRGLQLSEAAERKAIPLPHGHGVFDPHIWLDFHLSGRIIDALEKKLASLDPEGSQIFRENAEDYKTKLRLLDSEFGSQLKNCAAPRILIVAGHAAFGYLAERYGLEQTALYGLSPDSQPAPRDLIEVIEQARRKGVQAIFYETTTSADLARTMARELGLRVLRLNAGHNLSREEIGKGFTFFDIMRENLRMLKDGLGCH